MNDRIAALRAEFPVLRSGIYLNSNSTGAIPRDVEQVLRRYWDTLRDWRDDAWSGWLDELDGYLRALAEFLGAPVDSIVTEANLTTLLGRLATCFDFDGPRREVLITNREFPTVPFLWRGFARYGAQVEIADFDTGAVLAALSARTKLVCVAHGSYTTGGLLDLNRIVAAAHAVGAEVIVDAFQTVGTVPLNMGTLGVDYLLGGSHKWLCGAHTAFLYIRPDLIPTLRPAATGWFAGADPLTFRPTEDWADSARRLAGGTPIPLTAMISRLGLDLLATFGAEAIRDHSLRCTDRVIARADAAGIPIRTPRQHECRGGIVTLAFPGDRVVKQRLADREMVCSWRDGLRIAPHIYNTLDEVDAFMDALIAARQELSE
ncbi:aminotransferase class V-fold PLP-dependent enzyme [Nocardia panacis]|uniref:Aminotransferase class V-fold PLP-dependent enzyme n=1 Tax=Nocardia panacis TaxID=2340916 RepID=A0A3A4KBT2_9NOCA|nr:aminotransferase class V-fold PLP-dependent enzyme [Nocardia panacis]RJO75625.1 aminotransferase class V-fold PLP-dependent enzyme [Nocardia panacis]